MYHVSAQGVAERMINDTDDDEDDDDDDDDDGDDDDDYCCCSAVTWQVGGLGTFTNPRVVQAGSWW